jgi:polysaccharide pyruvyl transferase WcaK-like protein
MRRAGHPDLPYLAGYDGTEAAMGLLASAEVVIAERLHAAVLAAAAGTPFVSLEYRPKLADFARSIEMETFLLRTDEVTGESILGRVTALETDSAVPERLDRWVATYRTRLREAAARVEAMVGSGGVIR